MNASTLYCSCQFKLVLITWLDSFLKSCSVFVIKHNQLFYFYIKYIFTSQWRSFAKPAIQCKYVSILQKVAHRTIMSVNVHCLHTVNGNNQHSSKRDFCCSCGMFVRKVVFYKSQLLPLHIFSIRATNPQIISGGWKFLRMYIYHEKSGHLLCQTDLSSPVALH